MESQVLSVVEIKKTYIVSVEGRIHIDQKTKMPTKDRDLEHEDSDEQWTTEEGVVIKSEGVAMSGRF